MCHHAGVLRDAIRVKVRGVLAVGLSNVVSEPVFQQLFNGHKWDFAAGLEILLELFDALDEFAMLARWAERAG